MEQNKIFRGPYNREPSGGARRCVTRETILCEQYIEFLILRIRTVGATGFLPLSGSLFLQLLYCIDETERSLRYDK